MKPSDFTQLTDTISNSISQTISNTLSSIPLNSLFKSRKTSWRESSRLRDPVFPTTYGSSVPPVKNHAAFLRFKRGFVCVPEVRPSFQGYRPAAHPILTDRHSFHEQDKELESVNLIDFPGYDKKLENARKNSGEKESVVWGTAEIDGIHACCASWTATLWQAAWEPLPGKKISRAFEYAADHRLPKGRLCSPRRSQNAGGESFP